MAIIDDFCKTTISWATIASRNSYGDPTYNTPTTLLAKVENKQRMLTAIKTGEQIVSNTQVYINPDYDISVGDRITISGISYNVERIDEHNMFGTVDHKKLILR